MKEITKTIIIVIAVCLSHGCAKGQNTSPNEADAHKAITEAEYNFEKDSFLLALHGDGKGQRGFLSVVQHFDGTQSANAARYYAAICYINLGEYPSAVTQLSGYKPRKGVETAMKFGVLGDIYAQLANYDASVLCYKEAAAQESANLKVHYLMKYAKAKEMTGEYEEAAAILREARDKYANGSESLLGEIDALLKRVSEKGKTGRQDAITFPAGDLTYSQEASLRHSYNDAIAYLEKNKAAIDEANYIRNWFEKIDQVIFAYDITSGYMPFMHGTLMANATQEDIILEWQQNQNNWTDLLLPTGKCVWFPSKENEGKVLRWKADAASSVQLKSGTRHEAVQSPKGISFRSLD